MWGYGRDLSNLNHAVGGRRELVFSVSCHHRQSVSARPHTLHTCSHQRWKKKKKAPHSFQNPHAADIGISKQVPFIASHTAALLTAGLQRE